MKKLIIIPAVIVIIIAWAPWLSVDDAKSIVKTYPNFQEQHGTEGQQNALETEIYVNWLPFCRWVTTYEGGWLACFWQTPTKEIVEDNENKRKGNEQYLAPTTIEKAVHMANISQVQAYFEGEFATEGHVILGVETNENITTVYAISSYGWFGFENGIFTSISGGARIPAVIVFSQNDQGEYVLLDYQEPEDGRGNWESIKKMFTAKFLNGISNKDSYDDELSRQQEVQVTEYLRRIGRNAKINTGYVEKKLPDIDTEASNKLLEIMPDYFPYWLGTIERVENGARYIYETSQNKTNAGRDLIVYTKKKENGRAVIIYKYKIIGSEVFLQ